ncbi:MAG TPA: sulfotransferase [Rhizomicrobium sp.]
MTDAVYLPLRKGLFMITCAARTGSTMLVNFLQSHPQITCHMEIFNPRRVEGFFGAYRKSIRTDSVYEARMRAIRHGDPTCFLYKFAFDSQGRRSVGFKFKYDELLLPVFARPREIIAGDCDIAIVHLKRRNLLKRYLSWVAVNHVTGRTMRTTGEEPRKIPPIFIDAEECLKNFQETKLREAEVDRIFRQHQMIDLEYEKLTGANADGELGRLQQFLGVVPRSLKTVIAKLSINRLEQEIANYADLKRKLANTPYSEYFQE